MVWMRSWPNHKDPIRSKRGAIKGAHAPSAAYCFQNGHFKHPFQPWFHLVTALFEPYGLPELSNALSILALFLFGKLYHDNSLLRSRTAHIFFLKCKKENVM
jgi:hypothetical protein